MSKSKYHQKPETLSIASVNHWQGPLPSPASLEEFKRIDPSIPLKILEMAIKEQEHRHTMEKEVFEADVRQHDLASQANAIADNSNRREFRDKAITKLFAVLVIVSLVCSTAFMVIKTADWKAWLALGIELIGFASLAIKANSPKK